MRHAFALLTIILAMAGCATERTQIPQYINLSPRVGLVSGSKIDIVLFDGRIEATLSNELIAAISDQIIRAYPDIEINVLASSSFYSDPSPNTINIKIGIAAYNADFGTKVTAGIGSFGGIFIAGVVPEGTWNGITGLVVTVYDLRSDAFKKASTKIERLISKQNLWGYATADAALRESYKLALQDLLNYIDSNLMK